MDQTPKTPASEPPVFDPGRWVAAIVGGVALGEALWAMLQILIRDWAMPALTNLMGQGPTQNQGAFELQPLFVAFVEACLAGILLVIILAATRGRTRVVRVKRVAAPIPQEKASLTPAPRLEAPSSELPLDSLLPKQPTTDLRWDTPQPQFTSQPQYTSQPQFTPPMTSYSSLEPTVGPEPMPAPDSTATSAFERPVPPPYVTEAPKPTIAEPPKKQVKPQPEPKPKPKKPKAVYYNIVGEPIESDEE